MIEQDKEHIESIAEATPFDDCTKYVLLSSYFAYRSWGEEPNAAYFLLIRDIQQALTPKKKQFRWPGKSKREEQLC